MKYFYTLKVFHLLQFLSYIYNITIKRNDMWLSTKNIDNILFPKIGFEQYKTFMTFVLFHILKVHIVIASLIFNRCLSSYLKKVMLHYKSKKMSNLI